ncbi:MAG TPA: hypothetical protein VLY03_12255 [Bacteroidota bacterium]|nr:hypothetical protein [Bacteroidota bacterium]
MDELHSHTGETVAESTPSTLRKPRGFHPWEAIDYFVARHSSLLAFLIIVVLVILAWHHRFVQDDAFISFRYAKNLIDGKGLTWNAGERVEGYTNFFWTLLIAAGMDFGMDPVVWSEILGMSCFIITLVATYSIAVRLFGKRSESLLAIVLLGTNYTFICYATGGLETQLQAMLCAVAAYMTMRTERASMPIWSTALLSVVLSVAMLTRLDSSIFCFIFFAAALATLIRKESESRHRQVLQSVALILPLLLIVGTWFTWKLAYYGNILPNTYFIKASSDTSLGRGLNFLYIFFKSYIFWPFAFLFFYGGREILRAGRRSILLMSWIVLLWMAYTVKVGGDFMEFRFLVPVLPFFFIILTWLLFTTLQIRLLRLAGVLFVLYGSFHHAESFRYTLDDRIEPIADLQGHLYDPDQHWVAIGQTLGEAFGKDPSVTIATTAAGAIPYYSSLRAVDMLGLNDTWVARNGVLISSVPGHQRIAPMEYLLERNVNLVISHPLVLPLETTSTQLPMLPAVIPGRSVSYRVIEIPLDDHYKFVALYLHPHPAVDAAIGRNGWTVREISGQK